MENLVEEKDEGCVIGILSMSLRKDVGRGG